MELKLWQGLARYTVKKLGTVSLEGKAPGEAVKELPMSTIEDWKIKSITRFTLKLPGTKDKIAMCKKTQDVSGLQKVAQINREPKNTKITFYKICDDFREIACDGTPIGYLRISNKKGDVTDYTFSVETVPMVEAPDGASAFVDGSSGNDAANTVFADGTAYKAYGGAYLLYKPGEQTPFLTSDEGEADPIGSGLLGISESMGNVYGEINSAIMAVKKAEELGFSHLRLYYDCEQIGGHAPGGAFHKHNTKISQKYDAFWKNEVPAFSSLKKIELIHVDAHGEEEQELNAEVDLSAKAARDKVKEIFEHDDQGRELLLAHAKDY